MIEAASSMRRDAIRGLRSAELTPTLVARSPLVTEASLATRRWVARWRHRRR